jgi:hypothetical protein
VSVSQDAATLCYSLYQYPDCAVVSWDYKDDGSGSDGVYWAAVRLNGILWCVLRGSVTQQDWQRDFYDWVDPFLHDDLGTIHPGFYKGLPLVRDRLLSLAKPDEPIGVTGHSLGAGRASLLTGLLCVAGRAPVQRIVFGEPHSGGETLAKVVEDVEGPSYRADGGQNSTWEDVDEVTRVPPWFNTPTVRTDVTVTPPANDPWGVFKYHHMSGYSKAVGIEQTWAY